MTKGQIVAAKFKRQYCAHGSWNTYSDWEYQPEQIHTVLLELTSEKAITALLDKSWLREIRSAKRRSQQAEQETK